MSLQQNPFPEATIDQLKTTLAERSFKHFIVQAWSNVEPSTFVPNWHIDAIAEHLQAVYEGKIRNLIINIPPRMSKSLIVSVMFPAWMWIKHPEYRFLLLSYALKLSIRDNVKCRDLIRSPWYQERWGHIVKLKKDQDMKERFETEAGGFRQVTSIGSSATGEGGEYVICDDGNAVDESDDVRRNTLEWWSGTMPTRLNDPKTGSFINIQQRTGENDLTGHLLEHGGYDCLRLPMEYEGDTNRTTLGFQDPRTIDGELLCPTRFGPEEVAFLKRELGTFKAAGQLQQRPTGRHGGLVDAGWFREWTPSILPQAWDDSLISWDFSFSGKVENDYCVGQVWKRRGNDYYLLDQVRKKMDFVKTLDAVVTLCNKWPGIATVLVEEKANGAAVISTLKNKVSGLIPYIPKESKEARISSVAPILESGHVYIPGSAPWKEDFLFELSTFPKGRADDQCDCLSQALIRFEKVRDRGGARFITHTII